MKARLQAILFSAAVTLAGFTAVTYTACSGDKCKGIVCAYGGLCNDGACECLPGYEGVQCETINRGRFEDVWQVKEDGTLSNESLYALTIVDGPSAPDVMIQGLYNGGLGGDVSGFVRGDSLFINDQNINGYNIKGVGLLTDDLYYGKHGRIDVYYSVTTLATGVNDNFGLDSGVVSVWHK